MKSLNFSELDQLCEILNDWQGYQLQEVRLFKDDFYFGFYGDSAVHWLMISMRVTSPVMLIVNNNKPPRKNQTKKPLSLFLKSNFVGAKLESVKRVKDYGRVVKFEFQGSLMLEVRLFPHGQNISAKFDGKQLSFNKLKDLEVLSLTENEPENVRSLDVLEGEFFNRNSLSVNKSKPVIDKEALFLKKQKKIQKAISKVQKDLQAKASIDWFSRAQYLQQHSSLEALDSQECAYVDFNQSLIWNIENCFSESKKQKVKISGHKNRLNQLEQELADLESGGAQALTLSDAKDQKMPELKIKSKHKKMKLSEQSFVVVGKSAKDNHNLLREAAPFDIWLHLRDYPSSHGIIRKNKNYEVSEEELARAIQFLFKQNFGHKSDQYQGQKFEVIIAEKRYVKPIKGDSVGRVNYHSEKTLNCLFE